MLRAGSQCRLLGAGDRRADSTLFPDPNRISPLSLSLARFKSGFFNPPLQRLVSHKQNILTAQSGFALERRGGAVSGESRVVIVSSRADPASQNIAESLIKRHGFGLSPTDGSSVYRVGDLRLAIIDEIGIHAQPAYIPGNATSIIFASKHVSVTGTPALTVHATGNLGNKAEFGGSPGEVSYVDAAMVRAALREFKTRVSEEHLLIDVTMEATHHGPTSFPVPVCFVEIGSGPKEWSDPLLGGIAADAIVAAARAIRGTDSSAVGFGGTHYAAKHTRICMDGEYQVGHVIPKHAFESGVTDSVIRDTFRRTIGKCNTALLDWKGLRSEDRQRLTASLENWQIEVVRA